MARLWRSALKRATFNELCCGKPTIDAPIDDIVTLRLCSDRHSYTLELTTDEALAIPGAITLGDLTSKLTPAECDEWMRLASKVFGK